MVAFEQSEVKAVFTMLDMLRRRWITSVLCAAAVTAAVSFRPAAADDPYDVYAVLPLTGSNAFAGNQAKETFAALQGVVNRQGGIRGRPIRFVVTDSQSDPQVAVALTNEIVAKRAPLLIGDFSVATCNAMAALLKSGPVQFCLSPGFRPKSDGYSYVIGISAIDQAKIIFRNARERGWKKLALVFANDATGRLAEPDFAAVAALPENRDVTVTTIEHFNPTDVSISAQVARIRASGAQAVVVWVNGTPFATVLRSMKDAGLQLPVYASTGNMSYEELKNLADLIPKQMFFCLGPIPAPGRPVANGPLKKAQSEYLAAFAALGIKPTYSHASAWDTGLVAVEALRAAGPEATPGRIRSYVNALHGFAGVQAVFDFRSGDMRGFPVDAARLLRWDQAEETWYVASGPGGKRL